MNEQEEKIYTNEMAEKGVKYDPKAYCLEDNIIKILGGKLPLHEVPTQLLKGAAEAKLYGTNKYNSPDNWKKVPNGDWTGALLRHLYAYIDGETKDPESGLDHLSHMAITLAYMMWNDSTSADKIKIQNIFEECSYGGAKDEQ